MKQVEFVHIDPEAAGFTFALGDCFTWEKAETIIQQRAADGWDYCGWLPLKTRSNGELETISLMFQKEE